MNGYLFAYILAGSVIAPLIAEIVMNRHGDANSTERVINNAIAFWLWPVLVMALVIAAFDKKVRP